MPTCKIQLIVCDRTEVKKINMLTSHTLGLINMLFKVLMKHFSLWKFYRYTKERIFKVVLMHTNHKQKVIVFKIKLKVCFQQKNEQSVKEHFLCNFRHLSVLKILIILETCIWDIF